MYGVIDIGSNTIRLVIYKVESNKIIPMINKKCSVGLAGYINKKNCLKKKGIDKAIKALLVFKEILGYISVKEVFPFATASLRNISNSKAVLEEIKEKTGFEVTLLSGEEEAILDYYGVLQSIGIESGLMVDIGGGSTELVFFKDREVVVKKSLPIGSLNLYIKFVKNLIPTKKEIKDIENYVKERLTEIKLPTDDIVFEPICAVGGTARAAQKLLEDMDLIDSEEYCCTLLSDILETLKNDTSNYYENLLKSSADRIHTFAPGLIVLKTISEFYGSQSVITSKYGVREGFLQNVLQRQGVMPK